MPVGVQGFQKGHAKFGGHRKPGDPPPKDKRIAGRRTRYKTVSIERLREYCLEAMISVGEDGHGKDGALGYIRKFAKRDPRAFMTGIVAKLIPQQIKADITHDFDIEGAIGALESSINGILAARGAKDITPQITAGSAGHANEDVAILVDPGTEAT